MANDIGTGTAIVFGTSGFNAAITGVNVDGVTRPAIDTTHLGTTTARTFVPGDLIDAGTISLDIQFDPELAIPAKTAAETITITWPDTSTWAFSGFVTNYTGEAGDEELMTGTVQIKVTGDITITPAA